MARHVLLLRGINLGPSRRVPMADLRALLTDAGYEDVATYVQSGNIVLESRSKPAELESRVATLISERFGFDVPVCARSAAQLVKVLEHDPIPGAADEPKRYQVTFLAERAPAAAVKKLEQLALGSERVAAHGRELYTFHPDGIARSKLAKALTAKELGIAATARNWTTVRTLAEMAFPPSA
ncbi:MAG TPA: DUF1697 domain-containing protein [Solirubrobacteraceae bacterium]|jgi:uncharacterized protein (DUF1697 family)